MKLYHTVFRGMDAYLTDLRIPKEERREDLYYYEIRHSDEDWSEPCNIENGVFINHWGSIVFKQDIMHLMDQWAPGRYEIMLTDSESETLSNALFNGEGIEMEKI